MRYNANIELKKSKAQNREKRLILLMGLCFSPVQIFQEGIDDRGDRGLSVMVEKMKQRKLLFLACQRYIIHQSHIILR